MAANTKAQRHRRRTALCALVFVCGIALAAVPEYVVKAALLYKISKFVHWPDSAFANSAGMLRICVIGRDDFGESIDTLSGQKVQGQTIAVVRLPRQDQAATGCHIAFISRSERDHLSSWLAKLHGQPTLTMSDIEDFAERGGIVGLTTSNDRISFQINPSASSRAGLDIGAQLLQLATVVNDKPGEGSP